MNYFEEELLKDNRKIISLLGKILRHLNPHPITANGAVKFTGDTMQLNNLTLQVGQKSTASILPTLADGTTPSNGIVSGVTFTFNDPSATLTPSADGLTAEIAGVAPSSGAVGGSVAYTVTDTDGAVSTWHLPFTVTDNAPPPPQQITQAGQIQFTDPA